MSAMPYRTMPESLLEKGVNDDWQVCFIRLRPTEKEALKAWAKQHGWSLQTTFRLAIHDFIRQEIP
jgi:hypothetical protein